MEERHKGIVLPKGNWFFPKEQSTKWYTVEEQKNLKLCPVGTEAKEIVRWRNKKRIKLKVGHRTLAKEQGNEIGL